MIGSSDAVLLDVVCEFYYCCVAIIDLLVMNQFVVASSCKVILAQIALASVCRNRNTRLDLAV